VRRTASVEFAVSLEPVGALSREHAQLRSDERATRLGHADLRDRLDPSVSVVVAADVDDDVDRPGELLADGDEGPGRGGLQYE
jgi:hypothetical protein